MASKEKSKNEIIIYKNSTGPAVEVNFSGDTVWLNQAQISKLFDTDRSSITKHLNNIVKSGELSEKSNVQFLHIANSDRPVKFYNLDFIISVGYRVNSRRATQFRVWATNKLRDYIVKGFAIDKKRLQKGQVAVKELEDARQLFQQVLSSKTLAGKEQGLLKVITDYLNTWILLNRYDRNELDISGVSKKNPKSLDYNESKKSIERLKNRLMKEGQATEIFGQEVGGKLKSILGALQQTYGGRPVYESIEERAAHLLYLVIKDHPFVDGNKRVGSLLFLLYLIENDQYMSRRGERKIDDVALTSLALLVAESKPSQKTTMVKLIVNLIKKK